MAIKLGKQSEEIAFKLYQGVAAFNVLAVNPNKNKIKELTGREMENEPVYKGTNDDGIEYTRVSFYVKTNPDVEVNNGIELITQINFTLNPVRVVGASSGKTQIIDEYGRTAWATKEDLENKAIPVYSNGAANIDKKYRPVFKGEENLVKFLIAWLNIPNPAEYKNGTWVDKEDKSGSEVSLNMKEIISGNMKELEDIVELAKEYKVKAAVGIKTTSEGKQYQEVFAREFVKNGVTNYAKIDKAIADFKANGGAPNTEYSAKPLHEYVVQATSFSDPLEVKNAPQDNPWSF